MPVTNCFLQKTSTAKSFQAISRLTLVIRHGSEKLSFQSKLELPPILCFNFFPQPLFQILLPKPTF